MEARRFWLGCILLFCGVVMLFIALFLPPVGEIHSSVIAVFGEICAISGAALGLEAYTTYKMKKLINDYEEKRNLEEKEKKKENDIEWHENMD